MIGNCKPTEPGTPLDIDGFHFISRYWRLIIKNNFGSIRTSFHGIEFYGFDFRLQNLLVELNLNEYINILVENVSKIFSSIFNFIYYLNSLIAILIFFK